MHTLSRSTLAALGLAALVGTGSAAQAQEFPYGDVAPAARPAVSTSVPSSGVSQFAEFPRSALPATGPSASDHATASDYAAAASFPHSAAPAGTPQPVPGGTRLTARLPAPAIPRVNG